MVDDLGRRMYACNVLESELGLIQVGESGSGFSSILLPMAGGSWAREQLLRVDPLQYGK